MQEARERLVMGKSGVPGKSHTKAAKISEQVKKRRRLRCLGSTEARKQRVELPVRARALTAHSAAGRSLVWPTGTG